jgi:acetoacetyl-CoA synthetase
MDLRDKIKGVVEGMKECPSFQGAIIVQRFDSPHDTSQIPKTQRLESFLSSASSSPPPIERVGFQDPMVVYYSSGTTGTPKAIVHGVGPILVSVAKEAILHREITPRDVALQYTTTGWIMYLASVTRLAFGGRTVFYDGSPFVPDRSVLLRIVEEQRVTNLGISPRWLGELMKEGIVPQKEADLSSLTAVQSTGMVLKEQVFDWFYDGAFPTNIKLANFSGGTDIVSLLFDLFLTLLTLPRPPALSWRILYLPSTPADAQDELLEHPWQFIHLLRTLTSRSHQSLMVNQEI